MIVSVALLMIGVADIVRTSLVRAATVRAAPARSAPARPADAPDRGPAVASAAAAVSAVVLAVVASAALGLAVPWSLACLATTLAWVALVPVGRPTATGQDGTRDAPPLWPALAILALLVTTVAFDRTSVALPAGLDDALGESPRALLHGTSAETVLAVLAVLVVMTQTANLVVRAALGRDRTGLGQPEVSTSSSSTAAGTPASPARWSVRIGGRTIGAVQRDPSATSSTSATKPVDVPAERTSRSGSSRHPEQADSTAPGTPATGARAEIAPTSVMRGGRHIGPVERVLVLAALLAGAYPVVAGLLAAKSIVRFPEIAEDSASGNKAEEFLVGSMTSWLIAAAGAGYIALVSAG